MTQKRSLSSFVFLLAIFYSVALGQATSIPNRELIFLFDKHVMDESQEHVRNTLNGFSPSIPVPPHGIGAMTITALLAVHQEAAPMIVSNATIKNMLAHKEIFSDFVTKDRFALRRKYGAYPYFSRRIEQFQRHCRYVLSRYKEFAKRVTAKVNASDKPDMNAILAEISRDPHFNNSTAPSLFRRNRNKPGSMQDRHEMVIYLIAYLADLSEGKWIIKELDTNTSLLIPRGYVQQYVAPERVKETTDAKELTHVEKKLGLRVNHLATRNISEYVSYRKNDDNSTTKELLEKLFVTNGDYTNKKEEQTKCSTENTMKPPCWSFYVAGHGFPSHPVFKLHKQAKNLFSSWRKKWRSCFKAQEDSQLYQRHISQCEKHHIFQRKQPRISGLSQYSQQLAEAAANLPKIHRGIVASMTKEEFRQMLQFFNSSITTALLFYTSCYAGGVHLVEPYHDTEGNPLQLSYPVISGGLAESAALQEVPEIKLPPYSFLNVAENIAHFFGISEKDVDQQNQLRIHTTSDFEAFFKGVREGLHTERNSIGTLVNRLHPFTHEKDLKYETICNIPVWRPAGEAHFEAPTDIPSTNIITSEFCAKQTKIVAEKLNLLYTEEISSIVQIKGGQKRKNEAPPPLFISMQPGFAKHTFKQMNAPCLKLFDVIKSFMWFDDLSESKLFVIKKLRCLSDKLPKSLQTAPVVELEDVVIARNVFSMQGQSHHNYYTNSPMTTAAYIRYQNKAYKITFTQEVNRFTFNRLSSPTAYLEDLSALCTKETSPQTTE